jgi:hypothetical protein
MENVTLKDYLLDIRIDEIINLSSECNDYFELLELMQSDIKESFGEEFELVGTVSDLEDEIDKIIQDMIKPDWDNVEDSASDILTLEELPQWIVTNATIVDAKRELEAGHECPICRGSGEGMYDGSACHNCKDGMITFKGVFNECL